jgi:hypothetical protein
MPLYVAGRIHRASLRYGERTIEETIKDCSPRTSSRIEIRSFVSHFRDSSVTVEERRRRPSQARKSSKRESIHLS